MNENGSTGMARGEWENVKWKMKKWKQMFMKLIYSSWRLGEHKHGIWPPAYDSFNSYSTDSSVFMLYVSLCLMRYILSSPAMPCVVIVLVLVPIPSRPHSVVFVPSCGPSIYTILIREYKKSINLYLSWW